MGIVGLIKTELAKLFSTKTIIFTLIGLLLIPIVYAGILLSAKWGPYDYKDNLPVAVVNNDKGAVSDGQEINVGNDLVETLKEGKALGWDFVSKGEAKKGLDKNKYYMVIEIPEDFSQKVTTVLDENPQVPEIRYIRNEGMNFLASQVTNSAVEKIREQLGDKITATFATKVFNRFPEIADGFLSGADGAKQLKDGTIQLAEGTNTMLSSLQEKASDINRLAEGAKTAEKGANTLYSSVKGGTSSINKLNDGAKTLNSKVQGGTSSINQLNDGAKTLNSKVQGGTSSINQLNDGAKKLATSVKNGTQGINDLNDGAGKIADGIEELNQKVNEKLDTINKDTQLNTIIGNLATDTITVSKTLSSIPVDSIILAGGGSVQALNGLENFVTTKLSDPTLTAQEKAILDYINNNILTSTVKTARNGLNDIVTTLSSKQQDIENAQKTAKSLYQDAAPKPEPAGNLYATIEGVKAFKQQVINGLTEFNYATDGKANGQLDEYGKRDLLLGAKQLNEGTNTLKGSWNTLASGTKQLSDGTNSLKGSWSQLANGTKQLSDGTNTLKGSWSQLANGTKQLSDGTNQLVGSWNKLTNGAGSLASGLTQIASGNQTVANGWRTLIDGTTRLNDGAGKLRDGSDKLATGLDGGYEKVSAVKVGEDNINMIASPVNVSGEDVNAYEYYRDSTAPYILSLALFVTLLISSFFIDFKKPATTPSNAISWYLSKWVTLALFAIAQALIVSLFVLLVLKLSVENVGLFILFAIFVSITFMSIILFFVSIGQRIGRFLALAFIVLQLTITGSNLPIPMLPENLRALSQFLPLTYSNSGFKATISLGDTSLLAQNVAVLLGFLVISVILALAVFLINFKSIQENNLAPAQAQIEE